MDEQQQPSVPATEIQEQITPLAISHLKSTIPWMRFIAVFGMVICCLMVLGGIGVMRFMPFGGFIFIFYLVIALILFFPQLYLFQYANNIRSYIASSNKAMLEKAFERQKNYWMYMGVLLIIYLCLIVLILLIFAMAGATIMSFMKHSNPYMPQ